MATLPSIYTSSNICYGVTTGGDDVYFYVYGQSLYKRTNAGTFDMLVYDFYPDGFLYVNVNVCTTVVEYIPASNIVCVTAVINSGSRFGNVAIVMSAVDGTVLAYSTIQPLDLACSSIDHAYAAGIVNQSTDIDFFVTGLYTTMGTDYNVVKRIRYNIASNTFGTVVTYNSTADSVRLPIERVLSVDNNIVCCFGPSTGSAYLQWIVDISAGTATRSDSSFDVPVWGASVIKSASGVSKGAYRLLYNAAHTKIISSPMSSTADQSVDICQLVTADIAPIYFGLIPNSDFTKLFAYIFYYSVGVKLTVYEIDITADIGTTRSGTALVAAMPITVPTPYDASLWDCAFLYQKPGLTTYDAHSLGFFYNINTYQKSNVRYQTVTFFTTVLKTTSLGARLRKTINKNVSIGSILIEMLHNTKQFDIDSILRKYELITEFQIHHILFKAIIFPDDIFYKLYLDNGTVTIQIPLVNFTLRRFVDGVTINRIEQINATMGLDSDVVASLNNNIGANIKLYRVVKGYSQLLSTTLLTTVGENKLTPNLTGRSIITDSTNQAFASNPQYQRIVNSEPTFRVAPNFSMGVGTEADINGELLTVRSVVIFISKDQQFMELS